MIIQCEQCRTKFKLDDEKVTERGARVRCAKCRHVFTVHRPVAAEADGIPAAAATAAVWAGLDEQSFDTGQDEAAPESTATADDTTGDGFSFADLTADELPPVRHQEQTILTPSEPAAGGIDFGTVMQQAADTQAAPSIAFDFGEAQPTAAATHNISFDFTSKPSSIAVAAANGVEFDGFDFGEVSTGTAAGSSVHGPADFGSFAATPAGQTADSDFGFSFGDVAPQSVSAPSDGFDFSGLDLGSAQTGNAQVAGPADDGFSLGDYDFGAEAATVSMPTDHADQGNTLFSFSQPGSSSVLDTLQIPATVPPLAPAQQFTFEPEPDHGEAPPLSIASRRLQSPLLSSLIGIIAVLVIVGLGYMGYLLLGDSGSSSKLLGKPVQTEEGTITVQNVQASFLTKTAAGDLLVITGNAHNGFSKPRAALQLKVTLFDDLNQQLVSQSAYAGNQLTSEQLKAMTKEKIDAAMNNQFGDSLVNLEVPPGTTIPFTLVVVNPPPAAKDFTVESIGSTVASSGD